MKRKLLAMIVTYATSAGATWGAVEAYTYFEGEKLKLLIGHYWPLLFIVLPGILAVIAGLRTSRSKPRHAETAGVLTTTPTDGVAGKETQASQEERIAETELMLAFHNWWGSIKDYEGSGAEMVGSASEAGLMPRDPDMGTQLGSFEVVKIKTWPFLSEETKRIAKQTEETFLGFMARVYAGMYNHEVYGDLVPKEVMRNIRIKEMIFGQGRTYAFSECEQAYRVLQMYLEKGDRTEQQYQQPVLGQIWAQPASFSMRAVDRTNPRRSFNDIRACPLDTVGLTFDVTNPNELDMRLVRFFVDVAEFTDVNISRIYTGDLGGGAIIRRFTCEIGSRVARFECVQVSDDFDYIRLSSGEMETFRIDVTAPTEGVYRLRLAIEYSIAGEIGTIEADDDIQEIGFFDRTCHRIYNVSAGEWEAA
jgi:hypothetical protein